MVAWNGKVHVVAAAMGSHAGRDGERWPIGWPGVSLMVTWTLRQTFIILV